LLECRTDAQGWLYGTVRPVPGLPSLYRLYCKLPVDVSCFDIPVAGISWSAHPILFVINLAILLPALTVLAGLLALMLWAWRIEQRILNRRDSRPAIDTANPRANGALSRVASRPLHYWLLLFACAYANPSSSNAAWLVRQHRFDGGPFKIVEFVAHNSRLRLERLNHTTVG
jgi:hypothetical protein